MGTLTTLIVAATCSWAQPGHDRHTGDTVAAVDHYADIPLATRAELKRRIAAHRPDDVLLIGRDDIGEGRYEPGIRDMHFGSRRLCRTVDRSAWAPAHVERAMVWCQDGHCLLLPTVCGNLARITPRSQQAKNGAPRCP